MRDKELFLSNPINFQERHSIPAGVDSDPSEMIDRMKAGGYISDDTSRAGTRHRRSSQFSNRGLFHKLNEEAPYEIVGRLNLGH